MHESLAYVKPKGNKIVLMNVTEQATADQKLVQKQFT